MSTASDVLGEAAILVDGPRRDDYGSASASFTRLATLWSAVTGHDFEPHEVALCLVLLKVSRLCESPEHWDSWVDAAGYIGLGAEVIIKDEDCD